MQDEEAREEKGEPGMGIVIDGKLGHGIWVCERATESEWTTEAASFPKILRMTRASEHSSTPNLFIETNPTKNKRILF